MPASHYYLLTALPALQDLGATPPMSVVELLDRVAESDGPVDLCRVVALSDDLLQRDAAAAGELHGPTPAVLTDVQVRGEQPLPEELQVEPGGGAESPRVVGDAIWAQYFRFAAELANRRNSMFLREWVALEVGLRNALTEARAKALGLDAEKYMVAPELGRSAEEFGPVIAEWTAASNPLAAQKVLDRALWNALQEGDGWFSFADDELAAYTAKLMLVHRWWRLSEESSPPAGTTSQSPGQRGQMP
jgi:hypothetical protein